MTHNCRRVRKLGLWFLALCQSPDLLWYAVISCKVCSMDVWHAAKAAADHLLGISACIPVLCYLCTLYSLKEGLVTQ